jgi:SpoVK/Ycf46/Vps4 family AAA+-type ATPase
MKKQTDENYDWTEETSVKRKNLYSNLILIESDDSRRIIELLNEKPAMAKKKKGSEQWYAFDPLNGLRDIVPSSDSTKVSYGDSKTDVNIAQYGLASVLPILTEYLKKGNTVLVMINIIKTDDALNTALLGWATDEDIMEKSSTIILFVKDRSIFPNEVVSKANIVHIKKSTETERVTLLSQIQLGMEVSELMGDDELDSAMRLTAGLTLDQAEAAAVESILEKTKLDLQTLSEIKRRILATDTAIEIIQQPKFGFEAVGGYDALKSRLIDDVVLPLKSPEFAEIFDTSPPRGIIFYGPPGTGKTLLVKSMAKELNMSVLVLRLEHILEKYVGESEKRMRSVFDIADAMSPCILFIDELDRLSKRGGNEQTSSHVERELFSMLLEKLGDENREWFFVAATNIIESIDPALRRTGRIDSVAPVPFPDEDARKQIFTIHTTVKRKLPLDKDIDVNKIAKDTYMWSGSDIEEFVKRTAKYVMKEARNENDKTKKIKMSDFETIWKTFNIDIAANIKLQNKMREDAKKYCNDRRLDAVFEQAQKAIIGGRMEKAARMQKEE